MNILVIGSTGGTGRKIIQEALDQGHFVTAFARNPSKITIKHERLILAQGNVLEYDTLDLAMPGHDAVLCALGHKRWFIPSTILSEGTRNIIMAMQAHGVKRLVCETSLGIGDSWGRMGLYYTLFVIPFITYFYFRDKKLQEKLVRESGLDWVIVRPGHLTNGKKRGKYRHGPKLGSFFWTVLISRADVAEFMLNQAKDDTYLNQTVAVAN